MRIARPPVPVSALLALSTLMANASCVMEPAQGELEEALVVALDTYAADHADTPTLALGDIQVDGAWAHATAHSDAHDHPVVLLAHDDPKRGWYAVAPTDEHAQEYNALLARFPDTIIDDSTKAFLHAYPADFATKANFNGHELPWPAGRNGYVPKKATSGHENQIDFNIYNTDALYATKPGTVVFVKESSTTNCFVAPPDPCWKKANMVVIQHDTYEYSWYVHVAYNSVPVTVGAYVGAGTMIAQEGNTGYSSGKHLHYMASTGHTAWTDPGNPDDAPWATGITPVDFDESPWSGLYVGGTYKSRNTSDPAAVSWGSGRLDVFAQGEDDQLWHKSYNGSWGSWSSLGGTLTSSPDAASWGSGHMDVYVRGLDNNVYYRRYNGGWSGWQSAGAPPGGATSDPSAVSRGAGQIDVFVRGSDDALWWRSYANGGWSSWQSLGGVLVGGPDAASWSSSHMDVYVRGVDNDLYYRRYASGSWSNWQTPTNGLSSDPSATSQGWNQINAFWRGTDKALWHKPYSSGWGSSESLGGFLTSSPDATSWGSGHVDVFVRGDDDNIYHRWQLSGPWSAWESVGRPN